jgi:AcrR family transcriptional regulator
LEDAVLALAEVRDFASITVRDITDRAEVKRGTFYLHYRDKEDICARALDRFFEELFAEERAFVEAHPILTPDVIPAGLTAQFRHAAERPELFRRLLAETGSMGFAARFRAHYVEQFLRVWGQMGMRATPGSSPPELRATYVAASAQAVFIWWLDRGRIESVEQIAAWTWDLCQPLWFDNVEPIDADEISARRPA